MGFIDVGCQFFSLVGWIDLNQTETSAFRLASLLPADPCFLSVLTTAFSLNNSYLFILHFS